MSEPIKLTRVRGDCPDGLTCPAVYKSNQRPLFAVGKRVTDPAVLAQAAIGEDEVLIELPPELLPEVADGEL